MAGCRTDLWILLWSVVLVLLARFPQNAVAQACQMNCKTKNCTPEGVCVCSIPSPSTLLTGNRTFLGGVFCDVPAVMCPGSNTFFCESGGICSVPALQGGNYTCTCPPGFAGERCQFAGLICGTTYCYNGGICHGDLPGNSSCKCPDSFLGSKDCSVPTSTTIDDPDAAPKVFNSEIKEWWLPVGMVLAVIMSVPCMYAIAMRLYKWRTSKLSQIRFQHLRQVSLHHGEDFYNDENDDFFNDQLKSTG